MRIPAALPTLAVIVISGSAWLGPQSTAGPSVSIGSIGADIKILASDQLQGRGIGTRGEELAVDFIAKRFEKLGLRPAGERGTFFQSVPLVKVITGPAATLSATKDA